jgi:hypothetical protein
MSEEEFNFGDLNLELDEGTQARIAHAEFLEKIKEWGHLAGMISVPFASMAKAIIQARDDDDLTEEMKANVYQRIVEALPGGVAILVSQLNDLYEMMQEEAVKVLGEPFNLHDEHHDSCDGTGENCGHQDHYRKNTTETE